MSVRLFIIYFIISIITLRAISFDYIGRFTGRRRRRSSLYFDIHRYYYSLYTINNLSLEILRSNLNFKQ